jgi:hypothetical protein
MARAGIDRGPAQRTHPCPSAADGASPVCLTTPTLTFSRILPELATILPS